jgi:hypothetical protein
MCYSRHLTTLWSSTACSRDSFIFFTLYNSLILLLLLEIEVNLRPTVCWPVYRGVGRPSGTCDQFFFLLEISISQLRVCYFVAPSLMRGQVCNLLYTCFWVLPEQSLLDRSPAELTTIFYCLIWDSPNLEGQVPVFISPRKRVAQLYPPGTRFPFCCLLRVAGTTVEAF